MANLDYSEQVKIHALLNGLLLVLCKALVSQQLPTTLTGYVALLTLFNNQRRHIRPAPYASHTQQAQ